MGSLRRCAIHFNYCWLPRCFWSLHSISIRFRLHPHSSRRIKFWWADSHQTRVQARPHRRNCPLWRVSGLFFAALSQNAHRSHLDNRGPRLLYRKLAALQIPLARTCPTCTGAVANGGALLVQLLCPSFVATFHRRGMLHSRDGDRA